MLPLITIWDNLGLAAGFGASKGNRVMGKKLANRLDWNEMLGFEQVTGSRASMAGGESRLGAKSGSKPSDMTIGTKTGGKPLPDLIGTKTGGKPLPDLN